MSAQVDSHLASLLAKSAASQKKIVFYDSDAQVPEQLTYKELLSEARQKANLLLQEYDVSAGKIVLIHLQTHRQNIVWFWACILAECVPAMSTPFVNNRDGRLSHLAHLQRLLLNPLVITSADLLEKDFSDSNPLRVVAVEPDHARVGRKTIPRDIHAKATASVIESAELIPESEGNLVHVPPKEGFRSSTSSPAPSLGFEHTLGTFSHSIGTPDNHTLVSINRSSQIVAETKTCPSATSCSSELGQKTVAKGPVDSRSQNQLPSDSPVSLRDVAFLMLTSGSTGNAKAVCLTHQQIFASCMGKLGSMPMSTGSTVLNWIALDHVGSLVELHFTAMAANCNQIHVPASRMIADPLDFLRLLSQHQVTRTFAPSFFLHNLQQRLDSAETQDLDGIDLSSLRYLVSGGESNSVLNCIALSEHFVKLGVPIPEVIVPGFGMTETCAGCIYSRRCPAIDVESNTEFAALGTCIPGIEMRIACSPQSSEGEVQLQGPIVFKRYFNNNEANEESFTEDGWFRTGDIGTVDHEGVLRLVGRSKDMININGLKYLPLELEDAIEREALPGISRSSVLCFAHRYPGAKTEEVFIVYQHEYEPSDTAARMQTLQAIIQIVVQFTGTRPRIIPLPAGQLERTTLGKLSRNKIKSSFLAGDYQDQVDTDNEMLHLYRVNRNVEPSTGTQRSIAHILKDIGVETTHLDVDTPVFDMGITSTDLVQFKRAIEKKFDIQDMPIITIMNNITIRSLASAVDLLGSPSKGLQKKYDPMIVLQPHGRKTPLWLMHPGTGEMLSFLGLVQYFPDRPIYAMRARGFNPGEATFSSMQEILTTYHKAIKREQPKGPYAIAGYSYGSMIAFEIGKILEADNDHVQFLAAFNLPPYIKGPMRKLDFTAVLLHIADFCKIITEKRSEELVPELQSLPHPEQVSTLLKESDAKRCSELDLDQSSLLNWTNVSWSLQKIGRNHDPLGFVNHLDVFYCQPLKEVASSRTEFRRDHLSRWVEFIRDDLKFWEVDGECYTMIGPDHVAKFQQTLKKALAARGL